MIIQKYLDLPEAGEVALLKDAVSKYLPPVQKSLHSGNVIFNSNVPEDED